MSEEKVLSVALRPRGLSTLFGQDALVKAIRNHMLKRPPAAWMFSGPSGTGKTTLARILAVSYQCQHMKLWGDPCAACWAKWHDWAIHEINGASVTGIDELRKVVELSQFKPMNPEGKRVILIDEAHQISNSSMNLLLTPTEEPPPSTVWIVCTTEPNKIKATLRRRFTTYQLKPLGITAAEDFLRKQAERAGVTRPLETLFEVCHVMGLDAPAMLLQALDKFAAGASATEAVTGTAAEDVDTLRICKAVTSGSWSTVNKYLNEASPEHARLIRASVAGWLKGVLVRETDPRRQERAALSLLELCTPPYDDTTIFHWLWGTLWKITKRYRPATS